MSNRDAKAMSAIQRIFQVSVAVLLAAGLVVGTVAQARSAEGPIVIKLKPLSSNDDFAPKAGARLSDNDGLGLTVGEAVISPFTLQALIGGDAVQVSVPELRVDQMLWVADPVGCEDDDPKTKCYPTWGAEYSGQAAVDVPIYVEFADGGVGFSDYGVVSVLLNVTVVDEKVRDISGAVQITYSAVTNLPNYRIPFQGKLK
jgi:hypothetical protein